MQGNTGRFSAGDTVIFRSHGAAPQIYEEAEQKGLKIIDATCPHVRKAQKTAAALSKEGRFVIIIGEKRHPEVQSIKAWAGKDLWSSKQLMTWNLFL